MKHKLILLQSLLMIISFALFSSPVNADAIISPLSTFNIAPGNGFDHLVIDKSLSTMYVGNNNTINVYDLSSSLSNPTEIYSQPIKGFSAQSLVISKGYLYVAEQGQQDGNGNPEYNYFEIFHINNSTTSPLTELGSIQTLGAQPNDVAVKGNYAYVADWAATLAQPKVEVFNISNKSNPYSVSTLGESSTTFSSPGDLDIIGKYLYLTSNANSTLSVFNISDQGNPILASSQTLDGVGPIAVHGQYAYVAGVDSNIISVLSITNSSSPTLVNTFNPVSVNTNYAADPYCLVFIDSHLIVSTINGYNQDIEVYDTSQNAVNPVYSSYVPTMDEASSIADYQHTLYSGGYNLVQVFSLTR
jgi:hypothetical protein